jgi:DNA-binding transcriptional ArsR family regulator
VNELAGTLDITPSAVSQHLKILKHAGLVRNERKGYWIPYAVDEEALEQCQELLSKICTCGCKGTGRMREAELGASDDRLELLKKWQSELQRELNEVRCRIEALERER